jgi:hypothetical protein
MNYTFGSKENLYRDRKYALLTERLSSSRTAPGYSKNSPITDRDIGKDYTSLAEGTHAVPIWIHKLFKDP